MVSQHTILFARLSTYMLISKLLLLGGGGVGKSYLIRVISQYVDKTLTRIGDHPNRPKVILLAPTGIAASLIGK